MLVLFLVPDFGRQSNAFLVIPPTIGEMWMAVDLLVKGVSSSARDDRAPSLSTGQVTETPGAVLSR